MDKVVNKLINESVKGVDTYTHNGSTWLIFTDTKQWVIELTEDRTLWYNYNFFNGMFSYVSMDVVENQQYITKWVEDNIIGGVKETNHVDVMGFFNNKMEYALENGVKEIKTPNKDGDIKSTLEWMYKNNYQDDYNGSKMINNVIDNGIKETQPLPDQSGELIGYGNYYHDKEDRTKAFYNYLEETIKFGVKENIS